jgi:hypothetical protein
MNFIKNNRILRSLIGGIIGAIMIPTIVAQENNESLYIPDHPGYTYNALLVGLHRIDVEVGLGYGDPLYFDKNMIYTTTYFRYGAFKHLEFRYGFELGYMPDSINFGISGVNVGFKIPIISDYQYLPDIAIIANTYLPNLGVEEFSFPNYSPSLNLAIQKCFFDKLILFANTGLYYDGFNPQIKFNASFATYFFITPKYALFVETLCKFSNTNKPNNMADGGMIYYITDNIQLDLSFGANYVTGFNNFFINTGFNWRLPN